MKNARKRILLPLLMLLMAIGVDAQMHNGFDPAKFRADLHQFITVEACLTPSEAAAFFPLYDELNNKQRELYDKIRELKRVKPADEARCKKVIAEIDRLELEIKQLQAKYHNKFLSVISASKLYDVINAEGKFHRRAMKNAARHGRR